MKKNSLWIILFILLLSTAITVGASNVADPVSQSSSIGAFSSGTGSITTFFNSNNSFAGNMFDVSNIGTDPITITSFDINLGTGGSGALVSVFYTPGTYVGNETNVAAWTSMGSDTVNSVGTNVPTPLNVGGLTIDPGQSYGLYLTVTNYPNASMQYTNGANVVSNSELQLTLGIGRGNPDFTGAIFTPRSWNGTIYYDIISGPPPAPGIVMTQTVGGDPGSCATTSSTSVPFGGTAYYCYTVENTGNVTLTHHTVDDDVWGTVLGPDAPHDLVPGATFAFTVSQGLFTETTTSNSMWTASVTGTVLVATATGSATVTVLPPTDVTLSGFVGQAGGSAVWIVFVALIGLLAGAALYVRRQWQN